MEKQEGNKRFKKWVNKSKRVSTWVKSVKLDIIFVKPRFG